MPASSRIRAAALALACLVGVLTAAGPGVARASVPPTPQIIGGEVSPPGAWPMQAALLATTVADPFLAQFCGGTLVAARWVLTAAHCVEGETPGTVVPASSVRVAVGFTRLRDITAADRFRVDRIESNPKYVWREAWSAGRFDAALLHLARPLPGPYARLAGPAQDGAWGPGSVGTVVGWGTRTAGQPDYAYVLRQTRVPVVSDAVCQGVYPELAPASTLCAGWLGTGGRDACQGDSGGPLWVRADGAWRQVGIVSGGTGCAEPDFPGTYGDVRGMNRWITATLATG